MSTVKISQLTALTTPADDDLLLVTDKDASQSKKIEKKDLLGYANKTPQYPSGIANDTDQDYVLKLTDVAGTETLSWSAFTPAAETDPIVGAVTGIVKADGAGNISAAVAGTDYVATETDPVVGAVTGIVKADGAGNISAAVAGTDYVAAETDPIVGAITGIVKSDGAGNITAAIPGTDYVASAAAETDPVVGAVTGIVKADGAGNISAAVAGTDYLTTATLTETDPVVGAVTGAVKADGAGNISAAAIVDLSDVYSSMSPSDGQVLTYDTTNGWQAETPAAGYGDSDVDTHLNTSSATTGQILSWDGSDYDWTNTVDLGNWTITESAGVLYFATGGTNKMKLDASGNLTVVGDVTAYGTM